MAPLNRRGRRCCGGPGRGSGSPGLAWPGRPGSWSGGLAGPGHRADDPGLRTVTVVAAASSGIRAGRALPALVLGSSLFLQAHLPLGYALGPAARELLEQARLPVMVAAAVALAAVATLLLVRRHTRATRVLAEGACPACLALGVVRGRGSPGPAAAGSPGGGA